MKRIIETKKPKGIKQFLRDSAAISPVIATLILLVIAAVAAAGVGILTQKAQTSAESQTADKNFDVGGTVKIQGSTNALALTNVLVPKFQKQYPNAKVEASGGGLFRGLVALTTTTDKVDIAGEWGPWPFFNPGTFAGTSGDTNTFGVDKYYWPQTVDSVKIPSRADSVIQQGGKDAKYWETPIGHDVVAIVSNIKDFGGHQLTLNIVRDNTTTAYLNTLGLPFTWDSADIDTGVNISTGSVTPNAKGEYVLNVPYKDLQDIYKGTKTNLNGKPITPVQYETYSYAEQEFARFLRLNDQDWDKGTWQLKSSAKGLNSDKAVRDYISGNEGTIGFLPLGFATSGRASDGKTNVISAWIENNKITPADTSALNHKHNVGAYAGDAVGITAGSHEARNSYPSACLGAILARAESTYFSGALTDDNIHACLNEKIFYYTKGVPTGATKAFIDYATSPAGQKEIGAAGFVPLLS